MKPDFFLGAWLVQPSLDRLSLDGRTVQVRAKVMDLLVYMAGVPGTVVSKDTLLNEVWRSEAISESALTRTITELRSALGDDAAQPRFLETIPKRGYRLIEAVRPVSAPGESRPSRRRVSGLAIGIAGLLLSGSVAFLVRDTGPAEPTTALRVRPLTTWPGEEVQPTFSPDGTKVALVWSGKTADNDDIYVKGIADDSLVQLTTDPRPDRSPAWSPDGRAIAFVRESNQGPAVYLVPASGGAEGFVAMLRRAFVPPHPRILDWFDGRALVVEDQNSPDEPFSLVRLSVETGERLPLTSPPPQSYGDYHPAISPDGRMLAFARSLTARQAADIYVLPISGGEPRQVTFDNSVIGGLAWSEDGGSTVFSSERGAMAGMGARNRFAAYSPPDEPRDDLMSRPP